MIRCYLGDITGRTRSLGRDRDSIAGSKWTAHVLEKEGGKFTSFQDGQDEIASNTWGSCSQPDETPH